MKTINVKLSDSMIDDINKVMEHKREGATVESIVVESIEQGLYGMLYRYARNARKWTEAKENRQLLATLLEEKRKREETEIAK